MSLTERNRSNFSGTGNLQIAQGAGRSLGVFPVFFVLGVDGWALQSFGGVGIAKGAAGIRRKIFWILRPAWLLFRMLLGSRNNRNRRTALFCSQ